MAKLRFGIVGTGNIAHRFARAIALVPEAELTAVASRTREKAEAFGDEFGVPLRFDSYESMAASDRIDAAYIAVPHAGHAAAAILMMNRGKHVLCEKPMAVTAAEAESMIACAGKNRVFLMEAMWARFVPGTKKVLELIEAGAIGEVRGVEAKFCYTMSEAEYGHHVLKRENGGGSLLDVGIYGLNFASWYVDSEVEQMDAQADLFRGVDAHTCVLLKYKNGAIADLSSATLLQKPNEGYVYGTKGYIHLTRFYAPESVTLCRPDGTSETFDTPYIGNGFENEIAHVCDCVSGGLIQSPVHPWEQTLFILRQMDAIRRRIGVTYPQDEA